MSPVVWGLDLAEIKWSKFSGSNTWDNSYYLRRWKVVVYQCALIFCVVSESLGTAVLSDYLDGQNKVENVSNHRVTVKNDDYVGAGSYNIFAGVFVAFIFGAAYFFDLIWPERYESKGVRLAWKICGVLAVIFHLADALTLTIITAKHSAQVVETIPPNNDQYWWSYYGKHGEAPLVYKNNPRAIAAVVFVWLGWASLPPSCALLFMSINHAEKGYGARSDKAGTQRGMRSTLRDAAWSKQKPSDNAEMSEREPQLPEASVPPEARTDQDNTAYTTNEPSSRSHPTL